MEDHEILTVLKRTDPFEILEADVLKQLSKNTGVKVLLPQFLCVQARRTESGPAICHRLGSG